MKDKRPVSKWQWYSVKLLFECLITGEHEPSTIDNNYINSHKYYEESIILIKAQSFEHAYKIAENKARIMEKNYTNPYGELVIWKYTEVLDCFSLCEKNLNTGTEIYSRIFRIPKSITTEDIIKQYYPETTEDDNIDNRSIIHAKYLEELR